jgi:fluoride exporter
MNVMAVFLGGVIGTLMRYVVMVIFQEEGLPIATFTVNIIGTLGLASIYAAIQYGMSIRQEVKALITTGIFGSLTSFSAVAFETSYLINEKQYMVATVYIILSYTVGLIVAFTSYQMTKAIVQKRRSMQ